MALLKALLGLLGALAAWFRDRQLIDAGKAEAAVEIDKQVIHEVSVASTARATAERDLALHPDRLREPSPDSRD